MPALRAFQSEDVAAVLEAHKQYQCVLGRAATGLGKAVELAALVQHYMQYGRVMVLVDVAKLVRQLAETIEWFTGVAPGIEMADSRARNDEFLTGQDRVIVSTVQTQYAGGQGCERYRQFNPAEFSALLLDECELFLAPSSRAVVEYYIQGNPDLRVFGCSATPWRTDGKGMFNLFEHKAFDRDILWGRDNGWLVPVKTAFVRVSIDFSSLKVRKGEDGEKDYSAEEIASMITDEAAMIELAQGIMHVAGDRRSIICCPNVASAKMVAHYLEGKRPGCARVVYGEMTDEAKEDVMSAHKRGEFQFLSSVMMLTKGYDDPEVAAVFNCRKTRSSRLIQQILGRGTRVLKGIVEGVDDPTVRRETIAASAKPNCLFVNMVGIDRNLLDVQAVDIFQGSYSAAVVNRAKKNMMAAEGEMDVQDALSEAQLQLDEEAEQERKRKAAAKARKDREEAAERERRMAASVEAQVEVEYADDMLIGSMPSLPLLSPIKRDLDILRKAKIPESAIARMTPPMVRALAGKTIHRWKHKLCSWRQAEVLRKRGYSKEQLRTMPHDTANKILGWGKYKQKAVA